MPTVKEIVKQTVTICLVLAMAVLLWRVAPSIEIAWVCLFLLLTVYLFVFEIVPVDVAAIGILALLGLTTLLAPVMGLDAGLVDNKKIFAGFSSSAVISIIAVMILGSGLDKTGVMGRFAGFILRQGGRTEKRIIPIVSVTVATVSSFMQNIGAAALFLPVVSRISARAGLPMSRLLMPMGFCAILGGTMTLIGSSPLILLNDLIDSSNQTLPLDAQMQPWGLFSVTPIGVALIAVGVLYFIVANRFILPAVQGDNSHSTQNKRLRDVYGLNYQSVELFVPSDSELVGKKLDEIETQYRVRIIAQVAAKKKLHIGRGALARDHEITKKQSLAVLAQAQDIDTFAQAYGLEKRINSAVFDELFSRTKAGIAEIVVPPSSSLIGKSARDVWLRKTYGLSMIALHRDGETKFEGDDIRSQAFHVGDTLIVHTAWEALSHVAQDKDFLVITTEYPKEEIRPHKVWQAFFFFALALGLVLFTEINLAVALLTGAIGMVLTGVLKIEEAYQAVSWKTVFLLASLIPLGLAVETSGTAHWIAGQILSVVGTMPIWVIQTVLVLLTTFFTLLMSNVGATVLLVPLAVNIALGVGANPAVFALLVALATSNSFLIPTHQVNVLIMGPGGYRVRDFIKAGSAMTVLFVIVVIVMVNLLF